jgi:hypothetical protein
VGAPATPRLACAQASRALPSRRHRAAARADLQRAVRALDALRGDTAPVAAAEPRRAEPRSERAALLALTASAPTAAASAARDATASLLRTRELMAHGLERMDAVAGALGAWPQAWKGRGLRRARRLRP